MEVPLYAIPRRRSPSMRQRYYTVVFALASTSSATVTRAQLFKASLA